MKNDGIEEGRQWLPFEYTKQVIIPEADWQQHVKKEISPVKSLTGDQHGNKGPWTKCAREGRIYEEDGVDKLKNVGPKKQEILEQSNITKVKQLKCLHGQTQLQKDMAKAMKGIGIKTLTNYIDQALSAMPGKCPPAIDHSKSKTPYGSLYVRDAKKRLEESVSLNKYC